MIKNLIGYFEKKKSVDNDAVEEIVRLLETMSAQRQVAYW